MPLTDRLQDLAELEENLEHFTEIDPFRISFQK